MGKRVLFDSNLYISFLLLPPDKVTTISKPFDHFFFGELTVVVPLAIVDEIAGRVLTKPYLAERIRGSAVERLLKTLRPMSVIIPIREIEVALVVRDPNDDMILA